MGTKKKFAVLTSGGDAPSMNAAIYSFASAAIADGNEVYAVLNGYKGLMSSDFKKIDLSYFEKTICNSGTAIGSSRCLEFVKDSVRMDAVKNLRDFGFDGLLVIGGDGSYMGANFIDKLGFPVVALPGTIDNDVSSTHYTIGYFSALEEVFQSIKKIKFTSDSHSQVTFVEVMGRDCCDLSVSAALASGADYVITNKNVKTEDEIYEVLNFMISEKKKKGIVIVVTEKIFGEKFGFGLPSLSDFCVSLEKRLFRQVRFNVLGYTQRGADPSS